MFSGAALPSADQPPTRVWMQLGKRVEDAYGSDDDWGSASASSAEEGPQVCAPCCCLLPLHLRLELTGWAGTL